MSRFSHLHQSITYILSQAVLAGWVLEVVVGHCTYFGLVNRDLLAIFHSCYSFIDKSYGQRVPIWGTVREELRAFKGLMILAASSWVTPWSSIVYACDSFLKGYSVQSALWDAKVVRYWSAKGAQ